jgi:L-glyceraldehyde 3-phosphate reductase
MFERWVEGGLIDLLEKEGVGCIPFSPLAQGLLTNKYLKGIPEDSRAHKPHGFLKEEQVTPAVLDKIRRLNELAVRRDQTLAQMALAWILKDKRITSVLIGVSKPEQVTDSLQCFRNTWFTQDELGQIERILR